MEIEDEESVYGLKMLSHPGIGPNQGNEDDFADSIMKVRIFRRTGKHLHGLPVYPANLQSCRTIFQLNVVHMQQFEG